MPILGYLGYPFFGLIVFSYAALILNFIAKQDLEHFSIRLGVA